MPSHTGYRAPDALNLWQSIMDGSAGPREEVVHQVENQYSCDTTQSGGGCVSSMRMGTYETLSHRCLCESGSDSMVSFYSRNFT